MVIYYIYSLYKQRYNYVVRIITEDICVARCIFLELFVKRPVFQGQDEIHQLDVIYKLLGTPSLSDWPALSQLPWYELVKPKQEIHSTFRAVFSA